MTEGPLVRVPRLYSRQVTMWISMACGFLAWPGVLAWGWLTQSREDAVIGTVLLVPATVLMVGLGSRRHALDTARGELVRSVLFWSKRIPWNGAEVATVHNRGRVVLLRVRTPGTWAAYLPLVAADLGGERSQDPGFLRLLADEVQRWGGHTRVASVLRAQADHVAAGGPVLASPLAREHLTRAP